MYVIQKLNKCHLSIYHEKDTGKGLLSNLFYYYSNEKTIYKHDQMNCEKIMNEMTRNIKLLGKNLCFNNHEECSASCFLTEGGRLTSVVVLKRKRWDGRNLYISMHTPGIDRDRKKIPPTHCYVPELSCFISIIKLS